MKKIERQHYLRGSGNFSTNSVPANWRKKWWVLGLIGVGIIWIAALICLFS